MIHTSFRYPGSPRALAPTPARALVTCSVAACAAVVRAAFANSGVWFEVGEGIAREACGLETVG